MVQLVKKPAKPGTITVEPITLEEARLHLRLDTYGSPAAHPDDDLIEALITAAREAAENFTQRKIAYATYTQKLDSFPDGDTPIDLGTATVQSVSSIQYVDEDGDTISFSSVYWALDNYHEPNHIHVYDSWPPTKDVPNAVTIQYVAGYTDSVSPNTSPMPKSLRAAMLLMLGNWYENRESVNIGSTPNEIPMGAMFLMMPYRLGMGVA